MKKGKLVLGALIFMALAGTILAFKALHFNGQTIYTYTTRFTIVVNEKTYTAFDVICIPITNEWYTTSPGFTTSAYVSCPSVITNATADDGSTFQFITRVPTPASPWGPCFYTFLN